MKKLTPAQVEAQAAKDLENAELEAMQSDTSAIASAFQKSVTAMSKVSIDVESLSEIETKDRIALIDKAGAVLNNSAQLQDDADGKGMVAIKPLLIPLFSDIDDWLRDSKCNTAPTTRAMLMRLASQQEAWTNADSITSKTPPFYTAKYKSQRKAFLDMLNRAVATYWDGTMTFRFFVDVFEDGDLNPSSGETISPKMIGVSYLSAKRVNTGGNRPDYSYDLLNAKIIDLVEGSAKWTDDSDDRVISVDGLIQHVFTMYRTDEHGELLDTFVSASNAKNANKSIAAFIAARSAMDKGAI